VSAAAIARALRGGRSGRGFVVRCVCHDDRVPSLSIRDGDGGRLLVKCWAGCDPRDVLAELRRRGLLAERMEERTWGTEQPDSLHHASRRDAALRIWRKAQSAAGSIVEAYLASRGIALRNLHVDARANLRYHPRCPRPRAKDGSLRPSLPAMFALVEHVELGPVAVHATYLHADGRGKADLPKDEQRACFGPVGGGAVRFGTPRPDQWLCIGEGIESVASVAESCGLSAWAALSANGIRALVLPPDARMVLICADHDVSGTGQRAAYEAGERFLAEGRQVKITLPPRGSDFNDVLTGRCAHHSPTSEPPDVTA
jgi:putative DNA primase/helicase